MGLLDGQSEAIWVRSGSEERGCGYRVKKARIYVHLHL